MTGAHRGVLAIVLAALIGACGTDEERFQSFRAEAQQLQESGDWNGALLAYKNALKLRPTDSETNLSLALMQMQLQQFDGAFFYLEEAIRLDPTNGEAALLLASLLLGDDLERARSLTEAVLERDPANALAYVRRAQIELVEEDIPAALTSATTAVELDPESEAAWLNLGQVHMARLRAITLRGEKPDSEIHESAFAALEKALSLEGPGGMAQVDIARIVASIPGRQAEGLEALRKAALDAAAAKNARAVDMAVRDFRRRYERGGGSRAVADRLESGARVTLDPGNLGAWRELARSSEVLEAGAGDRIYQELLDARPRDASARGLYAEFLFLKGRAGEALEEIARSRTDGLELASLSGLEVEILISMGELDRAREGVDQLDRNFEGLEVELARARLSIGEGRLDEGVELLEQLRERGDPRVLHSLSLGYLEMKDDKAAAETATEALAASDHFDHRLYRTAAKAFFHRAGHRAVIQVLAQLNEYGETLSEDEQLMLARSQYWLDRRDVGEAILSKLTEPPEPSIAVLRAFQQFAGRTQPERTRELVAAALAREPGSVALLRLQFLIAGSEKDLAATLAAVDAAMARGDDGRGIHVLRAQVLDALGDWDETIAEARWVLERAPNAPNAQRLLSHALLQTGREQELIQDLEASRKSGGLSLASARLLAMLYEGQDEERRGVLEEILERRPDEAWACNDLAYILAERGEDLDRALTLAQNAVELKPEVSAYSDTLGLVYLERGLPEPALAQFELAIERMTGDGDRALLLYHKSMALSQMAKTDEALEVLATAQQIAPDRGYSLPDPD